jgi:hypothetical protein
MACLDIDALTESKIDKVATQYREATKFLGMVRGYLREAAIIARTSCEVLDYLDIDTAVGDQLTILGKALGWPRCHCAGQRRPVFGFACDFSDCEVPAVPVAGFCEAEWDCDGTPDYVEFCFTDDELYRRFLKARVITLTGDFTRSGISAAARELFGPNSTIYHEPSGTVAIVSTRLLSSVEISIAHLFRQVLPVPPGVSFQLWHASDVPFGFGEGWGGFCASAFPAQIPLN